ncbi:MAG: cysteine desulfurase family protein [Acidimicrobiia bacterium]
MIYLDYAATTPVHAEAIEAMRPFLADAFGNPSGLHAVARRAKTALEAARETVAEAFGARPDHVVFTAGGTEADNLALKGAGRARRAAGLGDGIVTTAFEHKGVLAPCERLAREGFRIARVGIGADGIVDLDALASALDDRTVLVSTMLVNNEVGTVQPLPEIAALVRARAPRAVLHSDAVQSVPWLDGSTVRDADLISISAHKFGGPKGVGALIVRGVELVPEVEGGGQERGLRSGTANVAGIVGMAVALRVTAERRVAEVQRVGALRDRLARGLFEVPGAFVNGDPARKVAGNLHLGFRGVEAETLLVALDQQGICAASGSSCSSGATEPSHVLRAMGIDDDDARSSIRLSLGFGSTAADVDAALAVVPPTVERLRGRVPSG